MNDELWEGIGTTLRCHNYQRKTLALVNYSIPPHHSSPFTIHNSSFIIQHSSFIVLSLSVPGDEGGDFVDSGGDALADRLVDENRRRGGDVERVG